MSERIEVDTRETAPEPVLESVPAVESSSESSRTDRVPAENPIVDGIAVAARLLSEHSDDLETAARKISSVLNGLTSSATVCRILFHTAVAEDSSLRSRFVADLLASNGRAQLARLLADQAIATGAKPWQRRRLESLMQDAPNSDFGEGARRSFDLTISADGTTTLESTGSDAEPAAEHELRSVTRSLGANADWLAELVCALDDTPVGIQHDVVCIRIASTEFARQALTPVLETLAILPVVPILVTESVAAALSTSDSVGRPLLDRARAVLLTPNRSGQQTIISIRGSELLDAGPSSDLVLPTDVDIQALGAALGLTTIVESPVLAKHVRTVVDSLRIESSRLLPLSSATRAFARLLRFRGTRRQNAPVRNILTGHLLAAGFFAEAMALVDTVPPSDRGKVYRARRIRALFGTGRFDEVADTADSATASAADRPLISESAAASAMLRELQSASENTSVPFKPVPGRILTILHASAPDQSGGYAVRAHSVLKTIAANNFEVIALTRPDFPEAANSLEPGATAEVVHDGIRYLRLGSDSARADGEFAYMREAIDHFAEVIRRERPSAVHLRSTYVSALPGLIAAKRFGLPVVYEVSGMWELVYEAANTARMEGRRARTVTLENAVLEHCDEVLTITEAMRDIISDRVHTRRPIGIMPNAVDTAEFASAEKNPQVLSRFGWSAHDPIIGYIGTFVGYEGLDILVRAIALVRSRGVPVRALLVGDGAESSRIRSLAADLGLDESTIVFTGRVPHDEVADLYSVIDVCAYPRLLTPATRAVSPLKPFEAMAAKKSVIVSDVPALAEIAGYGERGLVVPSGDVEALAEAISAVIEDPSATLSRVEAAAAWTESERSWSAVGAVMGSALDRLTS